MNKREKILLFVLVAAIALYTALLYLPASLKALELFILASWLVISFMAVYLLCILLIALAEFLFNWLELEEK